MLTLVEPFNALFTLDLELVLKKCPYLIKEMINIVGQLIYLGKHGRGESLFRNQLLILIIE